MAPGEMEGLAAELDGIEDASALSEVDWDLYRCLRSRIGLSEELDAF